LITRQRQVYLETYGCQMNQADSQMLRNLLGKAGWKVTEDAAVADLILINTCAVRQRAEDRVMGRVRHLARLKHFRPDLRIGLVGCMATHKRRPLLEQLPALDLLVGPDSYRRLTEILMRTDSDAFVDLALDRREKYEGIEPSEPGGLHAFVPVMRGCDRFCTFCVVPLVRGREKSVPSSELITQTEKLAASGTIAVTLLGQTVNSYRDGGVDFAALLDRIAQIPGLRRIRFTSPHPADFTRGVFEVMARHSNLCKHLHIPVQSGSNRILAEMKRGHTREEFLALVGLVRELLGEVSITTDLLAGFPSETAEEFEETLSLVRQVRFDGAFLFRYSARPGTYAYRKLADDVPDAEKTRRLRMMIDLQEEISGERYAQWIGRVVEVLVEGVSRRDPACVRGKADDFKTVVLPGGDADVGAVRSVRIARATSHTLIAEGVPDGSTYIHAS